MNRLSSIRMKMSLFAMVVAASTAALFSWSIARDDTKAPSEASPSRALYLAGCFGANGEPLKREVAAEQVTAVFAAVAAGDRASLVERFGGTSDWSFEIQPRLQDALASFEAGREALPAIYAASESGTSVVANLAYGFDAILADINGATLRLDEPIGGAFTSEFAELPRQDTVGLGPVFWSGAIRSSSGATFTVRGGGKVAIHCESGRISRLLLGPLDMVRIP